MISDLTIVVIDSLNYNASVIALDQTKKILPQAKVLIISDKEFYPCDKFQYVDKFDGTEHSRICLQEVHKHVDTSHALFIQYDGFPTQPQYWTDEFLKYDYIGSPWLRHDVWRVGNGGFSLRSKKLLELTQYTPQVFDGDIGHLEDQVISISSRVWLEARGIRYPSLELASQFGTVEPYMLKPSFGFHGHGLIPEYLGKEKTLEWLDAIDNDFSVYHRNLFTMPYYLWKWDELERLRSFMIKANQVYPGYTEKCWEECRWRIGLAYPDQDPWELQKMIFVYGYTGP
jgi:hypothetical protein